MTIYTPSAAFPNEKIAEEDRRILETTTYTLSVDFNDLVNPERIRHRKAKGTVPPRPRNAWILFLRDFGDRMRKQERDHSIEKGGTSRAASIAWENASPEVKDLFRALANVAKVRHALMYPQSRFVDESERFGMSSTAVSTQPT